MKKLFASLGLAAVGTTGLYAVNGPDGGDASKSWSLAATLRGFYDDNYYAAHTGKQSSTGFEVSPTFNLNLPLQQTEIGVKYTYGLYYYQKRQEDNQNPIDQTHQLDLWLDHAFSPRLEATVKDSVTVSQDPPLTSVGTATAQRVNGNNIANTLETSLHTDWTRLFSTALTYQNTFYDYENSGAAIVSGGTFIPNFPSSGENYYISGSPDSVNASYAGLLNRVEQSIALDLQWNVSTTTMALVGYQFGLVNFTGNELIAYSYPTYSVSPLIIGPTKPIYSSSRDNMSHYLYVGARHKFSENLMGNIKAGVQYTTYYNDPSATSSLGPYADASLIYTYAAGSYMQLGLTQSRSATDTVQIDSQGRITMDQETTVIYGSINHPLTSKLLGSLVGHYQYSTYHDGQYNSLSSQFYNMGLNLTYTFTRHFSSDLGYNFDYYTSPVPMQSYTRNRVYLGVTASY
jgi:hypothetical protein